MKDAVGEAFGYQKAHRVFYIYTMVDPLFVESNRGGESVAVVNLIEFFFYKKIIGTISKLVLCDY